MILELLDKGYSEEDVISELQKTQGISRAEAIQAIGIELGDPEADDVQDG